MSPTYWTASRIKTAARAHGWEIRPGSLFGGGWTCQKDQRKVVVSERCDGGLNWVRTRYPIYGGVNVDYYGPRFANKLDVVLDFLCDCEGAKCRRSLSN